MGLIMRRIRAFIPLVRKMVVREKHDHKRLFIIGEKINRLEKDRAVFYEKLGNAVYHQKSGDESIIIKKIRLIEEEIRHYEKEMESENDET